MLSFLVVIALAFLVAADVAVFAIRNGDHPGAWRVPAGVALLLVLLLSLAYSRLQDASPDDQRPPSDTEEGIGVEAPKRRFILA